jgi:glycosyltransferase involved in cell wall biosynthesis
MRRLDRTARIQSELIVAIYCFVHQNFPGQYAHLVRHLADMPGNRVYFITQSRYGEIPGVRKLVYKPDLTHGASCHPNSAVLEAAVRTGVAVAEVCKRLRRRGVFPDIIVGHCGWGETLFIKDVFPKTPVLSNFEFFFHEKDADVGFDREFAPRREDDGGRLRVRNAVNHMSADASDWGHTATDWQFSLFPPALQARITTLHEGTDTTRFTPNRSAWLALGPRGMKLTAKSEVITYVARNLEPYRGFHVFMRALPEILRRRPRAQVLIVGGDGVSYGAPHPSGKSFREAMLAELGDRIDSARVHFMGTVPADVYLTVLQISSVHVYLTYPFVLSWSFVEAMSTGCMLVASATPPVREYVRDGEHGVLVDFFDVPAISAGVIAALEDRPGCAPLRVAARRRAVDRLDLESRILPRWLHLLDDLMAGRTPRREPERGVRRRLGTPSRKPPLNA